MRFPIGFSTLGCPKWPWNTVLDQAAALGYSGIELRGLEGQMDLTQRPEFAPSRLAAIRKDLEAHDLVITDLGASSRLHERDPRIREAQLDEARRFIDLAHNLGAPWVRVFPNAYFPDEPHDATLHRIGETLAELGRFALGSGVGVLVESHGDLTDSASLATIMRVAEGTPGVGLVWDTHHTVVAGKEAPADTWTALGRWVHHTHIKDSVADGKDRRYVLLGQGTVGVRAIVETLARGGYTGFYGFEWEKVWHPEIDEPEVSFPQYAETMRGWLTEFHVTPTVSGGSAR
jgi:sugar phosphate isomerase/epimerase